MAITVFQPLWFILLIPLIGVLFVWRMPTRLLGSLRMLALVLVVLALCEPAVKLAQRHGRVVVVADRSASMPDEADARMTEMIQLLESEKSSADQVAVVAFGQQVAIEKDGTQDAFAGFTTQVGRDGSNLHAALERALALVDPQSSARILIVSDGRYTGRDPLPVALRCAGQEVAVDYRLLQRDVANDVAISHVDAPYTAMPGEVCLFTTWITSQQACDIEYELVREDTIVARGTRRLPTGMSSLTFRDRIGPSRTQVYQFRIQGPASDTILENNTAKWLVGVDGPKPILAPTRGQASGLVSLLDREGLAIQAKPAAQCRWSLEEMSRYSGVLLEDLPAGELGQPAMETLSAWIKQTGSGLMITGGKNSYGPGGYFKSPLEPIMPVSMELRREHRKLALAIVVALDRSGSMAASVGPGRNKMDLANLASAQVLDLLSPMDEMGVIAVDSSAHVIADCKPLDQAPELRQKILSIESRGGGIFVYEALKKSSAMISRASAGTKHIILFADAADAEQPGEYQALLAQCQEAGITVSVIGLGKPDDTDADFLRDVALRGQGRCFFTTDAKELPRLFAQDTFVVARSSFIDELTAVKPTAGMATLRAEPFGPMPAVGGYNLCYLRDSATLAGVTLDEYEAPLVATWRAGIGRVACYTGQADGEFAGPLAQWDQAGAFYGCLARWCVGHPDDLGEDLMLTQTVDNGICRLQLHLDPDRDTDPFADLPRVTTLLGHPGSTPASRIHSMQWTQADLLTLDIELSGNQTALSTVEVADIGKVTLPPVCLPYSPEYRPLRRPDEARQTLHTLADRTQGCERIDLAGIWQDLSPRPRFARMGPVLALMAVLVFLLEIFQRRTGLLLPSAWSRVKREKAAKEPTSKRYKPVISAKLRLSWPRKKATAQGRRSIQTTIKQTPIEPTSEPSQSTPSSAPDQTDLLDAMKKARRHRRW